MCGLCFSRTIGEESQSGLGAARRARARPALAGRIGAGEAMMAEESRAEGFAGEGAGAAGGTAEEAAAAAGDDRCTGELLPPSIVCPKAVPDSRSSTAGVLLGEAGCCACVGLSCCCCAAGGHLFATVPLKTLSGGDPDADSPWEEEGEEVAAAAADGDWGSGTVPAAGAAGAAGAAALFPLVATGGHAPSLGLGTAAPAAAAGAAAAGGGAAGGGAVAAFSAGAFSSACASATAAAMDTLAGVLVLWGDPCPAIGAADRRLGGLFRSRSLSRMGLPPGEPGLETDSAYDEASREIADME